MKSTVSNVKFCFLEDIVYLLMTSYTDAKIYRAGSFYGTDVDVILKILFKQRQKWTKLLNLQAATCDHLWLNTYCFLSSQSQLIPIMNHHWRFPDITQINAEWISLTEGHFAEQCQREADDTNLLSLSLIEQLIHNNNNSSRKKPRTPQWRDRRGWKQQSDHCMKCIRDRVQ